MEIKEGNKLKWFTPDSYDGNRTLSQHAFIEKERKTYLGESYNGNISLCGKIGLGDGCDYKKYIPIDDVESEQLNEEKACKTCQRIYNTQKDN